MGTEIHGPWVEYSGDGGQHWWCLAKMMLWTDYHMFTFLAGVQGQHSRSREPKGAPKNMSQFVQTEYIYSVIAGLKSEVGHCSPEDAAKWIADGSSQVWETHADGRPSYITRPCWHSASWMDRDELRAVAEDFTKAAPTRALRLQATLELLDSIHRAGLLGRIVFWFSSAGSAVETPGA